LLLPLLWAGFPWPTMAGEEGRHETSAKSAVHWLSEMNRSVTHRSFRGDFVYLSGRFLEAMELRHWIVNGRPRESLFSLTGEPRRIVRDADMLTITTWKGGKPYRVTHPSRGRLSPLKPLEAEALQRHYRLMMGKPARIAGREGVVVALVPRDDLRYGYRLTLDRESALPLDLTVMDGAGNLVSRIMFTRLRLEQDEMPSTSKSEPSRSEAKAGQGEEAGAHFASQPSRSEADEDSRAWTFHGLPAGFRVVSHRYNASIRQEHFVLSDGLATISAYIEPLGKGDHPFKGETSLGSVNAYGLPLGDYQMTVVGEVPHKTLRLVAQAVVRKQ
jgi:sigma-E factor negative regulatory protein RseB